MKPLFHFLIAAFLLAFSHLSLAVTGPKEVIENATGGVTAELIKLTQAERTDAKIRELVLKYIIPAVDEQRVAMGALGKYWRTATPEQRQAFIELYRELQIRTYSGAFKAFNGEKFAVEEVVLNDEGDKAIVKGNLKQADGKLIPIQFRLYQRDKNSPWLTYDAVVAGLSMVKTYRDQLSEKLQNISMDELLQELSQKNTP